MRACACRVRECVCVCVCMACRARPCVCVLCASRALPRVPAVCVCVCVTVPTPRPASVLLRRPSRTHLYCLRPSTRIARVSLTVCSSSRGPNDHCGAVLSVPVPAVNRFCARPCRFLIFFFFFSIILLFFSISEYRRRPPSPRVSDGRPGVSQVFYRAGIRPFA